MELINLIVHFDEQLTSIIRAIGPLSYIVLFLIIFAETGLVIFPFLPGDSLLFAAGTLAGGGLLNVWVVIPVLVAAAIVGDTVNYWVGRKVGARVFSKQNARLFKPSHLAKTQEYYEKYGGKTIILARFVPIVRTFAPFVAGVGNMRYGAFLAYNVAGALVWVISLTLAGLFFGQIPIIKNNFELAVIGIIVVSVVPAIFEYVKHKRARPSAEKATYVGIKDTFEKEDLSE